MSMYLALSISLLLILLMQSVNGTQFLNTTSLSVLFASAPATVVFSTDIVHLTSIYASL